MDEPPNKSAEETNEDLIREWDLYYASRAKEMGALSVSDYELVLHRMAKRQARRTKRLPPRSITPPPTLGAASPSPGKDEPPCAPEEHSTSVDREASPAGESESELGSTEGPPSRGVAAIREARSKRLTQQ